MEPVRKRSKQRDAILACLQQTHSHPTAEWVYAQLKPKMPGLSLGTVYRNLVLFRQEGLLLSVGTVKGAEHFDGCTRPHAHFICENCGTITDLEEIEFPGCPVPGSVVHSTEIRFRGICPRCAKEDKQ